MGKIELTIQVDESLEEQAQALGMSLAEYVEERLRAPRLDIVGAMARQKADPVGAAARAKAWAEENAEAIKDYNRRIAERGLFGDEYRRW